jgi:hypothetical protein
MPRRVEADYHILLSECLQLETLSAGQLRLQLRPWGGKRAPPTWCIRAAEVNAALAPIGAKLEKEPQLRPLAGLKTEEIQAAYANAKEAAGSASSARL